MLLDELLRLDYVEVPPPQTVRIVTIDTGVLFEETLKRYPKIELAGRPAFVESLFINQLKTLPVRLSPA